MPTTAIFTEPVQIIIIFILIILIVPVLVKYVKIPAMLGLIFAGIIIGSHNLNLISENSQSVDFLQNIGLLYIMFIAGLDIDMEQFTRVRKKSMIFGIFTSLTPGILSAILSLAFIPGTTLLGSILIGDIVASHTVMTYPLVAEHGVSNDESVVVVLGATLLTDGGALFLLAILVSLGGFGQAPVTLVPLALLLLNLLVFAFIIIVLVPKIAQFFFKKSKSSDVEFQFTFFIMLMTALAAQLFGLEPIIGAFIGGLSINRLIPKDSRLMQITQFFGKAFFIPIFMIYVGMLTDLPAFFTGTTILLYSLIFIFSLFIGKFIAAWLVGSIFRYNFSRIMLMFCLTLPQLGVTLATIYVGYNAGIIPVETINAGIIFIIVSMLVAPFLTDRYAIQIINSLSVTPSSAQKGHHITEKILLPITTTISDPNFIDMAGFLTKQFHGILYPLSILPPLITSTKQISATIEGVEGPSAIILQNILNLANELQINVHPIKRIDDSFIEGIKNSALEIPATLIVLEWIGYAKSSSRSFSEIIDAVLVQTTIPVVLIKIIEPLNFVTRILVLISDNDINNPHFTEFILLAKGLSQSFAKKLVFLDTSHIHSSLIDQLHKTGPEQQFDYKKIITASTRKMQQIIETHDLLLVTIPPRHTVFTSSFLSNSLDFTSQTTYFHSVRLFKMSMLLFHFPPM